MNNPRLAIRYAKSLIDLAMEQKKLKEVYNDILFLQSICRSSKEFVAILNSPVIKPDKKNKIIHAITTGKIDPLTESFLKLLTLKGREISLPEIINSFIDQYNSINKINGTNW